MAVLTSDILKFAEARKNHRFTAVIYDKRFEGPVKFTTHYEPNNEKSRRNALARIVSLLANNNAVLCGKHEKNPLTTAFTISLQQFAREQSVNSDWKEFIVSDKFIDMLMENYEWWLQMNQIK